MLDHLTMPAAPKGYSPKSTARHLKKFRDAIAQRNKAMYRMYVAGASVDDIHQALLRAGWGLKASSIKPAITEYRRYLNAPGLSLDNVPPPAVETLAEKLQAVIDQHYREIEADAERYRKLMKIIYENH